MADTTPNLPIVIPPSNATTVAGQSVATVFSATTLTETHMSVPTPAATDIPDPNKAGTIVSANITQPAKLEEPKPAPLQQVQGAANASDTEDIKIVQTDESGSIWVPTVQAGVNGTTISPNKASDVGPASSSVPPQPPVVPAPETAAPLSKAGTNTPGGVTIGQSAPESAPDGAKTHPASTSPISIVQPAAATAIKLTGTKSPGNGTVTSAAGGSDNSSATEQLQNLPSTALSGRPSTPETRTSLTLATSTRRDVPLDPGTTATTIFTTPTSSTTQRNIADQRTTWQATKPSQSADRTIWDLTGSATTLPGDVILRVSSEGSSAIQTSPPVKVTSPAPPSTTEQGDSSTARELGGASTQPAEPIPTTLPPPGTPEESSVRAVVSGSVTLTGSKAVEAIKSGATRLPNAAGFTTTQMDDEAKLGPAAIGGIVAGAVFLLVTIGALWYRMRKKKALTKNAEIEEKRPNTGFDFTDDPVTASTGRMRPHTMWSTAEQIHADGPFDARHDEHGRQSWYYADDQTYQEKAPVAPARKRHPLSQVMYPAERDEYPCHQRYESNIAHEPLQNPFAPPVPPSRAGHPVSRVSTYHIESPRPPTHFTDIYGAYESRPATRASTFHTDLHPGGHEDYGDLPAQTPATSTLLPWLKRKGSAPEVHQAPPVPMMPMRSMSVSVQVPHDVARWSDGGEQAHGSGRLAGGSPPWRPARPVMAQTPAGAGANEFNVIIPGFR